MGRIPGQHEGMAIALRHFEARDAGEVLAPELDAAAETERVGTCRRGERTFLPSHPGDRPSVVEANDQLRLHRDLTTDALDNTNDIGRFAPDRHEVDQADS